MPQVVEKNGEERLSLSLGTFCLPNGTESSLEVALVVAPVISRGSFVTRTTAVVRICARSLRNLA